MLSRFDKIKIWLSVFKDEIKLRPIMFLGGVLISISLLLSSFTAIIALGASRDSQQLSEQLEGEIKDRRDTTCEYQIYQAEREDIKLGRLIDRLLPELTEAQVAEVGEIIKEESAKLPPPSACLDHIPDVSDNPDPKVSKS